MGTSDYQSSDLFFGTHQTYDAYKKKEGIVESEKDEQSHQTTSKRTSTNVFERKLTGLDEDTLRMLKRTRCEHDPELVYMQPSMEFYDDFYNSDDENSDEIRELRQMKRVYRDYGEYLYAVQLRDQYIDNLIDKYGSEEYFYHCLQYGQVKEWLPHPITLSKRCKDYDLYLGGILPLEKEGNLSEEELLDVSESWDEYSNNYTFIKDYDIETSIGVIRAYNELRDNDNAYINGNINRRNIQSVAINDLNALTNVFRSWYQSDNAKSKDDNKPIMFENTPKKLREEGLNDSPYNHPGLLAKLYRGEEIKEDEPKPTDLVHDAVTNRPMTRKELETRELIRMLKKFGWSEGRLMQYLKVGSKLERANMRKKARRTRKKVNLSMDIYDTIGDASGVDPVYVDVGSALTDLKNVLFED